jgi:hypothetical protein
MAYFEKKSLFSFVFLCKNYIRRFPLCKYVDKSNNYEYGGEVECLDLRRTAYTISEEISGNAGLN